MIPKIGKTLVLVFLLLSCSFAFSQTFDDFKKQIRDEYDTFEKETQQKFDNFVAKIDKEYSEYLLSSFRPKKQEVLKPNGALKPNSVPEYNETEVFEEYEPDFKIITAYDNFQGLVYPGIKKTEAIDFTTKKINADFLGWPLYFNVDEQMSSINIQNNTPEEISRVWDEFAMVNYNHFLGQVAEVANVLNLNNWAYYQLIKECSNYLYNNNNDRIVFQWVMLTRSRYKVRIGFQGTKLRLLVPTVFKFYDVDYITSENINYYVIDGDGNEIITYDKDFPEADIIMNCKIDKPFNTNATKTYRDYNFNFNGNKYTVNLGYDEAMMKFYRTIPLSDLVVYFNSVASPITKTSVTEAFKPMLKDLDETEKLNLLLSFVQQAFPYKSDTYEYGEERYMFPDEVLHYLVSDCEDRSVLFAYLVKTLLGNETLIVTFPGHVATAVNTKKGSAGIWYYVDDKNYIIADPTFVGAPIGMTILQARNKQASLLKLNSGNLNTEIVDKIRNSALESGIYNSNGSHNITLDNNGNYYVFGYTLIDDGKRAATIARYNDNAQMLWLKVFRGEGNTQTNYLLAKNGNIFISGSVEKSISSDNHNITTIGAPDVFMSKIDSDGNIIWLQKAGIDKVDHSSDFLFAVKFNQDGKKIMAKLYSENEEFDHFGMEFDKQNNILFKGSFFATSGLKKYDELVLNTGEQFDIPETLYKQNVELKQNEYESTIAGLFSALNLLASYPLEIQGAEIKTTFDRYNKSFPSYASEIYNNINRMKFVKNDRGIITIKTIDGKPVLLNKISISNDSRIRIIRYKSGNVLVEVLSGIYVGNKKLWLDLNSVKLFKETGDLLLDYDSDNSVIKINLKKEILNKPS